MSDPIDPQAGAPSVTNSNGQQSARMTGGGPLQWEPPTIEEMARLFPNYEILALLGRGGMGAVYKARQVTLDRLVAIKLLPLEVSANEEFADRFVREARTMAKLNHPNIIAVYEFGTSGEGHLFFVMEFVEGANLHAVIHEVGLKPDQALWLAGEVCSALAYAHGKGVVHRDIKPANVMVDGESHVKVADFGLARLTDSTPEMHGMTMTGMVMGTPDYMAPEQKRGMNVDHRADIYGLGVLLYEMVCREVPQGAFDLPSRRTGCDQRLDAIVLKAMQQAPERRYQSAEEMEIAVEAARKPLPSAPVSQAPAAMPKPRPPDNSFRRPVPVAPVPEKSRTLLYAGVGAVVLGLIGMGTLALQNWKPKPAGDKERPVAISPQATPGPIPPAEPPKEQPLASLPEMKPRPIPPAEPPKEQPLANLPEMKPALGPAPETPVAPPVANAQNATEKWLAEQEPQWRAAFVLEVTTPFENGVAQLKKQYLTAIEAQLAAATRSGQLDAAVAFREEIQMLAVVGIPAEDGPATSAAIKSLRAGYRKNFAVLETDRMTKAKAVHARYDTILAQNQTLLTQRERLDEALQLKAKREELATSWITFSTPSPVVAERPRSNPQVPPAGEHPKPPAGIVLGREKLVADRASRLAIELGRLLAIFPKPAPSANPEPNLAVYQKVTYLMPLEQARQALGLPNKIPSKGKVEWPGFPKDSFSYVSFEGMFDASFSQLYFVVDRANQVVSVELVEDKPKIDDTYSYSSQAADWRVFDFVNSRTKSTSTQTIRHTLYTSDSTGVDWNTFYRDSDSPSFRHERARVYRIDSVLTDPGGATTSSFGYTYRTQKPMRSVRWYLPRPLAELMVERLSRP